MDELPSTLADDEFGPKGQAIGVADVSGFLWHQVRPLRNKGMRRTKNTLFWNRFVLPILRPELFRPMTRAEAEEIAASPEFQNAPPMPPAEVEKHLKAVMRMVRAEKRRIARK